MRAIFKNIDKKEWLDILTLALGIALLPPLWAIASSHLGITTGSAALISAAFYVVNGNKIQDGIKISLGFICGDIWAYCSLKLMYILQLNPDIELFIIFFVLGFLAVIISSVYSKWIYLPTWLCGGAIGLALMASVGIKRLGNLPIQVGVSMLVGVWYVGVGVDKFQKIILKLCNKKKIT